MRAPRRGALSMLLPLGSLAAASLAAAPTPDWPHYGGDAGGTLTPRRLEEA